MIKQEHCCYFLAVLLFYQQVFFVHLTFSSRLLGSTGDFLLCSLCFHKGALLRNNLPLIFNKAGLLNDNGGLRKRLRRFSLFLS